MRTIKLKEYKLKAAINECIDVLQSGGIIIYPTDTCYGIGVDAANQKAVDKLINYKTFRNDKPISIAVENMEMADKYAVLNKTAKNLYKELLPGPFTIISKCKKKLAQGVASNRNTYGIRVPNYEFVRELIKHFGKPITTTSANVSYKKTPYCVEDILNNTNSRQKKLIDLIVDDGTLKRNKPSAVLDTTLDDINVLREGGINISFKKSEISNSVEDTIELGKRFIKELIKDQSSRSIILCLEGELGTGKTQFTKGVASYLGVKEEVISPTYNYCREYNVKKYNIEKLFHIDAYKFYEQEDLIDIGFLEMINTRSVIAIEWAGKVAEIINKTISNSRLIWINLYHTGRNNRKIEFGELKNENTGNRYLM
jgi:L-threonylcarbamoyladenylate synthase